MGRDPADFYADPDAGPLLANKAYAALREEFPKDG